MDVAACVAPWLIMDAGGNAERRALPCSRGGAEPYKICAPKASLSRHLCRTLGQLASVHGARPMHLRGMALAIVACSATPHATTPDGHYFHKSRPRPHRDGRAP